MIVLSGLSEIEQRTFLLADNKVIEKAGWDRAALAVELNSLAPLLLEAGLDISLTGFEAAEIDSLSIDFVDLEAEPLTSRLCLRNRRSAAWETCGGWAPTAFSAETPQQPSICVSSWPVSPPRGFLLTRPLTSRSKPSRVVARSSTASFDGLGRDVQNRIRDFPYRHASPRQSTPSTAPSTSYAWIGGISGDAGGRQAGLFRAEEPDRVEQDQMLVKEASTGLNTS